MAKVIEVRILASADPSLKTAIRPLVDSVRLARQQAAAETKAMESDKIASVRRTTAADVGAARDAARRRQQENNAVLAAQKRAAQEELRAFDSVMREKQRLSKIAAKEEEKLSRDRSKAGDSAARDAERRAKAENDAILNQQKRRAKEEMRLHDDKLRAHKAEEHEILRTAAVADKVAQRTGKQTAAHRVEVAKEFAGKVGSNVAGVGRAALGVGSQFLQGAGVDLSVGSIYGKTVELRKRSTELSNAGYMPKTDDSPGIERVDPKEIEKQIKSSADVAGFSRLEASGGLQKFVGKTGDLRGGLDTLRELSILSRATGASLEDMADAAGDVSNALGETVKGADKAKAVVDVMKQMAGQGKIGSVEVKDLAVQMAALGAASESFEGNKSDLMGTMGAIVQMSRAHGGSKSAAQAATSVSSMVNTLKTPARIKEFHEAGVDIYNEQTHMMMDPKQIIMNSISKSGGDAEKLHKMWANVQGGRAVEGFANVYREARAGDMKNGGTEDSGDAAGRKAMEKKFTEYKNTFMGDEEIDKSFKARMDDPDVKAEQFNAKLQDIAEQVGDKLLPAFMKLAPQLEGLAEAFAKTIGWAAENPGKAITYAIVGSIAKAGLETALREGLTSALKNAFSGGGGNGKPGAPSSPAGPGALGNLSAGLTILATSVAITAAGVTLIDEAFKEKEKKDADRETGLNTSSTDRANAAVADTPALMKEADDALNKEQERLKGRLAAADNDSRLTGDHSYVGQVSGALNWVTAGSVGTSYSAQEGNRDANEHRAELKEQFEKNAAALEKLHARMSGTQNVHVVNMPAGGGPIVDPGGRVPPTPGPTPGGHG